MTFEGGGFSYERYLVSMNQYNGFHEQVFGENLLVAPRLCVGLVFLMPLGDSRKSESIQRTSLRHFRGQEITRAGKKSFCASFFPITENRKEVPDIGISQDLRLDWPIIT